MRMLSYAQNGEDVLLWRALGHIADGFYIDVGANDPVSHSVTKAFYDAGWHGINIEPLPALQKALEEQRPRDINLALAAGASSGSITLYDVPAVAGWASPDPDVAAGHRAAGHQIAVLTVPLRTLSSICEEHAPAAIHFLKIDVEGFEAEVLRGMDLARWRPWVLVIEATVPDTRISNHAAWEHLVTQRGYRYAWFDGLNRYYVAEEHAELAHVIALQPNVFDDAVSYHLDSAWKAMDTLRSECEKKSGMLLAESLKAAERASLEGARRLQESGRATHAARRHLAAEARASAAIEQVHQLSARVAEVEGECGMLQNQLATLRNEADTRSAQLVSVQGWASELERHLLATRRSTSWRVTLPLRLAGSLRWRVRRIAQQMRTAARRAVLRASANERLRRLLIPLLLRFPGSVEQVSRLLASARQPEPPPASGTVPDMSDELRSMPAEARRVLGDLQRARQRAPGS